MFFVKDKGEPIYAAMSGHVVSIGDVDEPIFAGKVVGDGVAIIPADGDAVAPISGVISFISDQKHTYGITGDNGIEVLLHIGIDTVKLRGTGFISYFDKDQHFNKGDELMEFWDPTIKKAGLDDTVIVTVTNSEEFDFKQLIPANQEVTTTDNVMEVTKKDQEK